MERFFKDPGTIKRFRSGPLGPWMQPLVGEFIQQGYKVQSIRKRLRTIHQFGCWLRRCRIPLRKAKPSDANRYVARHGKVKEGDGQTLRQLFKLLTKSQFIPIQPLIKPYAEKVLDGFADHLRLDCGLSHSTISYHRLAAKKFLLHRFGDKQIALSTIEAQDVIGFVNREATRLHSMQPKSTTTALRAFFRYLQQRGFIDRNLATAVPSLAHRPGSNIPRGLTRDQVKRVLASCNRKTGIGRRDYAILLLLARLGLRAGEVCTLHLEDIDWLSGTISVLSKGGKHCKLPLPQDVGQAIATYIRRDRPSVATRRVFLRVPAPVAGFQCGASISLIVKYAPARAGVQSSSRGAHQFRHTLATEMLRNGASLPEIGEVLRHQHPKTTFIYTKVDFTTLRPLARRWPGGVK